MSEHTIREAPYLSDERYVENRRALALGRDLLAEIEALVGEAAAKDRRIQEQRKQLADLNREHHRGNEFYREAAAKWKREAAAKDKRIEELSQALRQVAWEPGHGKALRHVQRIAREALAEVVPAQPAEGEHTIREALIDAYGYGRVDLFAALDELVERAREAAALREALAQANEDADEWERRAVAAEREAAAAQCPKGDDCALNDGARHCKACGRNWPPDETWVVPAQPAEEQRRQRHLQRMAEAEANINAARGASSGGETHG